MMRGLMSALAALLLAGLLLAACGSRPLPPEPPDPELARLSRVGQLAFQQGRMDQAATLFREALARARTRDDTAAIADQAINLSVAELRRFDNEAARDVAREGRLEMGRRQAPVPPELPLVEATARWRLGDPGAEALARQAAAQPATAERGSFLLGLIAADRRDAAALAAVRPAVRDAGDAAELEARALLLAGNAAGAKQAFLRAAAARQDTLDYAAMGRALAGAAAAMPADADAAALWLRAGRAAAGDRDRRNGEAWLQRAVAGGGDVAREARIELTALRDSAPLR
jgi:hypothetical protein